MPPNSRHRRDPPESSEYNERYSRRYTNPNRRFRWPTRMPGRLGSWWWNYNYNMPDSSPANDQPTHEGKDVIKKVVFPKSINGLKHYTEEYETLNPVIRRGWSFQANVQLRRPLKQEESIHLKLWTNIDEDPSYGPNDTKVILKNPETATDNRSWSFLEEDTKPEEVVLKVTPPTNAVVCKWRMQVNVMRADQDLVDSFTSDHDLYIIFNAWEPADGAYMADKEEREEYVLNEDGAIWFGSGWYPRSRRWDFAQFEDPVLECAMYLLDQSTLKATARRSPVHVSRKMSAMVNSQDDEGVLIGNWSGDYSGGTSPSAWSGSLAIIEEYMKTKQSVSYGQCWVFSALVTTLLRALGLPTRSVTNFDSAHDTNMNMTKDELFDENMEKIDHGDSVWNFHVWNEVFIKRPDLPDGYDGWQAIDATPQETSEGIYQLGPVPLCAIKSGDVYLKYDGQFVYGEVNADKVTWQWKDGQWKVLDIITDEVGTVLLTKAVGPDNYEKLDVTDLYKYKERTKMERIQMKHAIQYGRSPYVYHMYEKLEHALEDVKVDVRGDHSVNIIADNFTYIIGFSNTSGETRTIESKVTVKKIQYTGVTNDVIFRKVHQLVLDAEDAKKVEEVVDVAGLLFHANDDSSLKVEVVTLVKETQQVKMLHNIVDIDLPTIEIKVDEEQPRVGQDVEVQMQLPNPFDKNLTSAYFIIEGAGLEKPRKLNIGVIKANKIAGTTTTIVPKKTGKRVLHATFSCTQFKGARGSVKFFVRR